MKNIYIKLKNVVFKIGNLFLFKLRERLKKPVVIQLQVSEQKLYLTNKFLTGF